MKLSPFRAVLFLKHRWEGDLRFVPNRILFGSDRTKFVSFVEFCQLTCKKIGFYDISTKVLIFEYSFLEGF